MQWRWLQCRYRGQRSQESKLARVRYYDMLGKSSRALGQQKALRIYNGRSRSLGLLSYSNQRRPAPNVDKEYQLPSLGSMNIGAEIGQQTAEIEWVVKNSADRLQREYDNKA